MLTIIVDTNIIFYPILAEFFRFTSLCNLENMQIMPKNPIFIHICGIVPLDLLVHFLKKPNHLSVDSDFPLFLLNL